MENEKILLEVERDRKANRLYIIQIFAYFLAGIFMLFMWSITKYSDIYKAVIYGSIAIIVTVFPLIMIINLLIKYFDKKAALIITNMRIINRASFFNKETEILWKDIYSIDMEGSRTLVSRYEDEKFITITLRNRKQNNIYVRILNVVAEELYNFMLEELEKHK